jgi:hypothetical protein
MKRVGFPKLLFENMKEVTIVQKRVKAIKGTI